MDLDPNRADLKSQRILTATYLSKNRDKIKKLWELKAAGESFTMTEKQFPVIGISLGVFLDELSAMLLQKDPDPALLSEFAMSKIYGGEKAIVEGFSLSRLLWEFGLVRETIILALQKEVSLTPDIHRLIDKAIDAAMSLAATEFEKVHNTRMQTVLTKVETSNRDLEEFAMIAAHDLKSPLATATGFLDLLKESLPESSSSEVAKYIIHVDQSLTNMRNLVNSLLEYARLNSSTANFKTVSLTDVLRKSLENLSHLVEQSGARIDYGLLPEVIGDFDLLSLVFQNLISNSIKYRGASPPKIEISVREESPKSCLLSIKDNGIGFKTEDQEEIFRLYKRLKNNKGPAGAGIGLATCRKIIELHGGNIRAESQPGVGSTFYFSLPHNPVNLSI